MCVQRSGRLSACVSVCLYRCVSERSAAFTPLPLGTPCVALRIFPSVGRRSTVKRPDRRRAEAALWRAAKAEGRAPGPWVGR